MPMFHRKPRSLEAALLSLADSLDRHTAEIRALASKATPAAPPPSPAADPLDAVLIDVANLEQTEEESAAQDELRPVRKAAVTR